MFFFLYLQALDQCVNSLNDLGIQRISAKDTATAAQVNSR